MTTRALAYTLAVLLMGCSGRIPNPPTTQLASATENTVALCQGGWTQTADLELAAALGRRDGRIISRDEVTQRGADTFQFGELEGEEAVEAYNTYVECVLEVMERRARGDASSTSEAGNSPLRTTESAIAWELYEVGRTPSGERVIQVPTLEETRVNEEVQLQVVLPSGNTEWSSRGIPQWRSIRCNNGSYDIELVGSGTSYVGRFYIRSQFEFGVTCTVGLRALLTDQEWNSQPQLHNRSRNEFHWWQQIYNIVILPG